MSNYGRGTPKRARCQIMLEELQKARCQIMVEELQKEHDASELEVETK